MNVNFKQSCWTKC